MCAAPETAERPDELAPSWRSSGKCAARLASGRCVESIARTLATITSVSSARELRRTRPRPSCEWTTQLRLAESGTGRSSRPGRQKPSEIGGIGAADADWFFV